MASPPRDPPRRCPPPEPPAARAPGPSAPLPALGPSAPLPALGPFAPPGPPRPPRPTHGPPAVRPRILHPRRPPHHAHPQPRGPRPHPGCPWWGTVQAEGVLLLLPGAVGLERVRKGRSRPTAGRVPTIACHRMSPKRLFRPIHTVSYGSSAAGKV